MVIQPVGRLLPATSSAAGQTAPQTAGGGFASLLQQALHSVNQTVAQSETLGVGLAAGAAPSIADAVIAATQARLAVDLTVQVRNRVVSAYNQIMNMQI